MKTTASEQQTEATPPSAPEEGQASQPFTARIARYRCLWLIALGVFVTDQASKYWVTQLSGLQLNAYPPHGGIVIWEGVFALVHSYNTGAAWGLFAGQSFFLAILAVLALVGIYSFRNTLELWKPWHQFIFGLLIGGIAGNLVDRVLHGHVIDFLDVHLQFYRWPTFNLADSAIVVGTLLYLIQTWRTPQPSR